MTEDFKGYRSPALDVLHRFGAGVWSEVTVTTRDSVLEGLILPRTETADPYHLVLKLPTGYNIGIHHENVKNIVVKGRREAHYKIPEKEFPVSPDKPNVVLLGTGGTIASRLDYRTGAVIPAFSPGELYGAVPELADICNLTTKKIFGIFSEDMCSDHWKPLAEEVARVIEEGADGVVIGHGTDTMHHTASVLSFMLQDLPVPVVMVGSQRSSDRPSSDAAINLISAVYAAGHGPIAEVMICMFGPTSDQYNLLHRGTRVRKMHSSYRSTFRTLGAVPLAMVEHGKVTILDKSYRPRDRSRKLKLDTRFEDKVTLLYFYPNMQPDIVDALVDLGYKGIVIAGTGLGHVNRKLNPSLKRAIDKGVHVCMTVQTLWGYAQMYVYDTGRDLLELGVIPCANMLPETAFSKLSWVLGHTDDPDQVREEMTTPIAGEITPREPPNGYLVFQGGVPEVQEFIKRIPK